MRLTEVYAEGFRCFGSSNPLQLALGAGITTLVGENDSGKTAIIDAIRLALGTRGDEYARLQESDFHVSKEGRTTSLTIRCSLDELTEDEQSRFLEWCTLDAKGTLRLHVTLSGRRTLDRVWHERHGGFAGGGPAIDGELRAHLYGTYLRPLRDAERELRAGRYSRLSQILARLPEFAEEHNSDQPDTLAEILKSADDRIRGNQAIKRVETRVNQDYLGPLALGSETLSATLELARNATLPQLLARLELVLAQETELPERVPRGLGMNNVLFMAAELLLLQSQKDAFRLLLVEEPEAHLHPQLQVRFMGMLRDRLKEAPGVQVLVSSHSPILAAGAPVESLVLTKASATYPLRKGATKLESDDYDFLRRFLDATKANLFFAKGVLIVEGDSENLLLPALARRLERPLETHGVSIVKVGHTGLFRYARVFQRTDNAVIPVPVACIADRDVPPAEAAALERPPKTTQANLNEEQLKRKETRLREREGGCVRVFVSPQWTLEFDLAANGLAVELHQAVRLASTKGERDAVMDAARQEVEEWRRQSLSATEVAIRVFEPLFYGNASKAETAEQLALIIDQDLAEDRTAFASRLPAYLRDAIEYVTTPLRAELEGAP